MRNAEEENGHAAYMDFILLAGAHNLGFFFSIETDSDCLILIKKAGVRGAAGAAL
jgi:hypothetical protein